MIKHHVRLTEIRFGQCLYPWQHYDKDHTTIWQDCNIMAIFSRFVIYLYMT